jgi:hypothetical protein
LQGINSLMMMGARSRLPAATLGCAALGVQRTALKKTTVTGAGRGGSRVKKTCRACREHGIESQLTQAHLKACPYRQAKGGQGGKGKKGGKGVEQEKQQESDGVGMEIE